MLWKAEQTVKCSAGLQQSESHVGFVVTSTANAVKSQRKLAVHTSSNLEHRDLSHSDEAIPP